jgi:hypothetical protein
MLQHEGKDYGLDESIVLGFGGLYARPGDHIGHFYHTQDEWRELLVSFLHAGLTAGDKCVYLLRPEIHQRDLYEGLAAAQIDVEGVLASGQLMLHEGHATPEALHAELTETLADLPASFRFLRWGGDMTWTLKRMASSERLMAWENLCNLLHAPMAVFFCQYDLTQFPGDVIIDALKTHPLCIIGEMIHRNPYYREPSLFLEELYHRQSTHKD